jgi:hypothetical protein
MSTEPFVIEVNHLVHKYGRTEAVNDLSQDHYHQMPA